jgi:hypothetical protein
MINYQNRYYTANFWWEMAKILYFIGLDFEDLYGRNTIGNTSRGVSPLLILPYSSCVAAAN